MKICWDNLEHIRYNSKTGKFYKNRTEYIYMESCKICKEPYLKVYNTSSGIFCGNACSHIGKKHTEKTKNNISKNRKGKRGYYKGGYSTKDIPIYDTYAHQIDWCEKVRRNKEDKNILEVKCAYCGKWHIPKLNSIWNRIKSLNGKQIGEHRLYCSISCKNECPIYRQHYYPKGYKKASSREVQPELRQLVFERDNWTCRKCGSKESLHCHHIEGIRWEPLESCDIDKCITYCKKCHKEIHKKEGCKNFDMRCKEI